MTVGSNRDTRYSVNYLIIYGMHMRLSLNNRSFSRKSFFQDSYHIVTRYRSSLKRQATRDKKQVLFGKRFKILLH